MTNYSMGSILRNLREKAKLSVKEVVLKLKEYDQDISEKTLYSYESGKRAASAEMFIALCQIYNCKNVLEVFANIDIDYSIPDDNEWGIIEKYRSLDTHGKEMVNFILKKEWERSTEQNNVISIPDHVKAKAARNDYIDEDDEIEKTERDLGRLKPPPSTV